MIKFLALFLLPFVFFGFASVYKSTHRPPVYGANSLEVTYNGTGPRDAIFEVYGMLPGDEETKDFNVKNVGPRHTKAIMSAIETSEHKDFAGVLEIELVELPETLVFSGLLEDFFDHSPFRLNDFGPEQDRTYQVKVSFPASAGNQYQEAKVVFKLIWEGEKFTPKPTHKPWWRW